MGDLGPAGDFLAQDFECFRRGVGRLDDEGVGQRVAWQAGDDFGHAFARLHALQRLFAGHETPLAGGRLAQPVLDFADFLLAGIEVHEQADLLARRRHCGRGRAGCRAARSPRPAASARCRSPSRTAAWRAAPTRRRREAPEPAPRRAGDPGVSWAASRDRGAGHSGDKRSIQCWSWVAMTTVTPTWLKDANNRHDFAGIVGVEVAGRFVGQQDGRAVDDGAGDAQALLLAAGERDRRGLFARRSRPTLSSAARARRARLAAAKPTISSGSITLSNTLRSNSSLWSWKIRPRLRRR